MKLPVIELLQKSEANKLRIKKDQLADWRKNYFFPIKDEPEK
jgi:hypothetical protein